MAAHLDDAEIGLGGADPVEKFIRPVLLGRE
jgi:hypothetical protein